MYKNNGAKPIRFKSVKPSCGCTTVQTQQDEVPPGTKGEILARMNIGDRTGTQEKTVTVETDDPLSPTTVLTIKAIIPQPLEVTPTFLYWQSSDKPEPKIVSVKVSKDWNYPVRGIKATSSSLDFQANVQKTGKDEFTVAVQPHDTARSETATVTIEPEDSTKHYVVNLRVFGSDAAASLLSAPSSQPSEDLLTNPFSEPASPSPAP